MRLNAILLSIAVAALTATALPAAPRQIDWAELAPPSPPVENPFEALTDRQMDALRTILRQEGTDPATRDAETAERVRALRAELAEEGLDVDALFARRLEIIEKRNAAANAVSPELLGVDVRLPGYVLPLELVDGKAVEFLLVPTVGACIHTPAPPANQMIHVSYPEGIEVKGLYDPVWISGILGTEPSIQQVRYVDGQSNVAVSYTMRPELVTPY